MRVQDAVQLRHLVSDGLIAARKPKGPDASQVDSPQRIAAATAAALAFKPHPVSAPEEQLGVEVLGELVAGILIAASKLEGGDDNARQVLEIALQQIKNSQDEDLLRTVLGNKSAKAS